ncbi:MAG: deoxyribodipyrimidine photo-lyase [Polaribacter sp.]|jgi:deoxyribodipyrimidine photo-lyase
MKDQTTLFWFRRDLRLQDNAGLYHALRHSKNVIPVFIFDKNILDELKGGADARVQFLWDTLNELKEELEKMGASLLVKYGTPEKVWKELISTHQPQAVYTNRDYETYAIERDEQIKNLLLKEEITFHTFKDQVIFEKLEVTKADGLPYTVFTPYKKIWLKKLETKKAVRGGKGSYYFQSYPTEKYFDAFAKVPNASAIPTLKEMGFEKSNINIPSKKVAQKIIKKYDEQRDFPAIEGTSRLGIHFRFGTISIREKARKAASLNATYLSELVWRDFYAMILANFPHVVTKPFRAKYSFVEWRYDENDFKKWCEGKTGYPMVDAGMRQLNETGFMHNRVRMVVASFLTKHLLIDWRWGEAYFAKKLLDFDLASNSGGWQWAAGCGTDAAPYFRIFNPESQLKKFDPQFKYVKQWVPEYGTDAYPEPMVEHKFARERCLERYKAGLAQAEL